MLTDQQSHQVTSPRHGHGAGKLISPPMSPQGQGALNHSYGDDMIYEVDILKDMNSSFHNSYHVTPLGKGENGGDNDTMANASNIDNIT